MNEIESNIPQKPTFLIYSNVMPGIMDQHILNIKNHKKECQELYLDRWNIKYAISFAPLIGSPDYYGRWLKTVMERIKMFRDLGIDAIPWNGLWYINHYQDWFDPAQFEMARVNIEQLLEAMGTKIDYACDTEPYGSPDGRYPDPHYDTLRCIAAMHSFHEALCKIEGNLFYYPGHFDYAEGTGIALQSKGKVIACSEWGYGLIYSNDPHDWVYVDAELAASKACGLVTAEGFLDGAIRPAGHTKTFEQEWNRRSLKIFNIFPSMEHPEVWQNYHDHFWTKAWFDWAEPTI